MSTRFFTARYLTNDGALHEQDFFCSSEDVVLQEIARRKGTPLAIRPRSHSWWQRGEWYSVSYKINFLRALAMHVSVRGETGKALITVINNEPNRVKRRQMQGALAAIESGGDFSTAVDQLGFFDSAVVAILRGGEKSGMREAINLAISRLETRRRMWNRFWHTGMWIFMEFTSAVSTPPLVKTFALPWLVENASQSVAKEDWPAFQEKVSTAAMVNDLLIYWTVLSIVLVGVAGLAYFTQPDIRRRMDDVLAKVPIIKGVLIDSALSASFQIAAAMIRTRASFEEIARTLTKVNRVGPVRLFWERVSKAVDEGKRADEALVCGKLLTRNEAQVIGHHADAAHLEALLEDFAYLRGVSADNAGVHTIWAGAAAMGLYILLSLVMFFYIWQVYDFTFSSSIKNSFHLLGGA